MKPTPLSPTWRFPLYASVRSARHVNAGRFRGSRIYRFYCLARLFGTNGRMTSAVEVEYSPEEPFSFLSRDLFNQFQPATVGIVQPNAVFRRRISHDLIRIRLDFDTDNPTGVRQTLYLPMMLPQSDASLTTPELYRIHLGNDVLERGKAEVNLNYFEVFQRTQQYPPIPCGSLTHYP
jgi:hypothetical protein